MMAALLFGLFGCGRDAGKAVTSAEAMTLTQHGMRGTSVYEITVEGETTELHLYRETFSNGEVIRIPEKSVVFDTQVLIEHMNTCHILRWDGFDGKHPKNVLDGIMFNFSATVNGGQTVHAKGSANFPKGYREFVRSLNAILAENEQN